MEELFKRELHDTSDELIHCPLCRSRVRNALYTYTLNGRTGRIYHCDICRFMFLRPLMLDTNSARRMDSLDDAELFNNDVLKALHRELIVKREIYLVKKMLRRDSFAMLDIGCGTGWTSSLWKDAGVDVTGLEPSPRRAAIAKERYGLKIIQSYIEDLHPDMLYDVIVMRHVIEHLEDPVAVLKNVRMHLKRSGLALIIVPNINCIGRYIFGSRWSWVLPWHCGFYSPRTIHNLTMQAELDIVQIYQTPSPLWYPESFLRLFPGSRNLSRRLYSTLNLVSLLPFVPIVLLGYLTGFSDNITIIARMREGGNSQ